MDLVERASEIAVTLGRPNLAATLNGHLAWQFYYSPLPVPDALAWLRRSLEIAGENGFSRAMILMELGRFEAMTDVGDAWRCHFDEAKTIIDDLGLLIPIGAAAYPKKLGATEVACGEPARVLDFLMESCSTLDRLGDPMIGHLATLAATTAEALHAAGRVDDAEHYASWAMDLAESPDEHADWRMAMSRVRSTQGRHAEAVTLAREALDLVVPIGSEDLVDLRRAHLSLARALRGAGDEPEAVAAAHEARQLATAKQDQAALRRIDAFLDG
jgi:tetratricopeptide (TPR) repeat protein